MEESGLNDNLFAKVSGLTIVAILVIACFQILFPFLGAMLWGSIIAISTWPLFKQLQSSLVKRRNLAAPIMTLGLICIFVVPISVLLISLTDHIASVNNLVKDLTTLSLPAPPAWLKEIPLLGSRIDTFWQNARADLPSALESARPFINDGIGWVLKKSGSLTLALLEFLLAIILAGFMYANEQQEKSLLERLFSRIAGRQGLALIDVAGQTIRAVSIGVVGTALIQALLSVFGFAIAGVPGATLLGLFCFLLAMLQVGTGLVWIPVAIWLSYQGSTGWAIFTVIWGILINISDNFIKPYLISHGSGIPIPLVFLGVLGGLLTWGFIGIFVGPTLLVVSFTLLSSWLDTPVPLDNPQQADQEQEPTR